MVNPRNTGILIIYWLALVMTVFSKILELIATFFVLIHYGFQMDGAINGKWNRTMTGVSKTEIKM